MEYLKLIPTFFAGVATLMFGAWDPMLTILVALVGGR